MGSAEATAEGLWLQVGALLLELGVVCGERRLLVLGDGASWIRSWFEGLGIDSKAMVLCWWDLRKRCYESMSSAGGPKDRRREFEKKLLGQLWRGEVEAAIELLKGALGQNPRAAAVKRVSIDIPGEAARVYPRLRATAARRGSPARGWRNTTIKRGYVRCKHRGTGAGRPGVLALAALEAARRNGELDEWRRVGALPERPLPEPVRQAA